MASRGTIDEIFSRLEILYWKQNEKQILYHSHVSNALFQNTFLITNLSFL